MSFRDFDEQDWREYAEMESTAKMLARTRPGYREEAEAAWQNYLDGHPDRLARGVPDPPGDDA